MLDIALVLVATSRPAVGTGNATAPAPILPTHTFAPTLTVPPITLGARVRLLAPVDDHSAWRTAEAACGGSGAAVIERTADDGATWTSNSLPNPVDTGILAISSYAITKTVAVLAATAKCKSQGQVSSTAGNFRMAYPNGLPSDLVHPAGCRIWHTSASVLTTPSTTIAAFAVRSSIESAVVCQNADLQSSSDGGATCQLIDVGASAITVARTAGGYQVPTWSGQGCSEVRLATIRVPDLAVGPCDAKLTTAVGTTLASSANKLWLWSGDTVVVSGDWALAGRRPRRKRPHDSRQGRQIDQTGSEARRRVSSERLGGLP